MISVVHCTASASDAPKYMYRLLFSHFQAVRFASKLNAFGDFNNENHNSYAVFVHRYSDEKIQRIICYMIGFVNKFRLSKRILKRLNMPNHEAQMD